MATLYTHQSQNVWKTWGLMTLFFVLVILLGWFFSFYFHNPNILYFFVIFSIAMNVVSYWFSDKIVLSMSAAKPASREEYFDLYTVTENLSITAGLPLPKIYIINDPAPNAFATGRDKNHAVVCATTGLLSILNKTELEGVIAHELSHVGNRDMLLSTVVVVLVGFVSIASNIFMRSLWLAPSSSRGGGNNDREGNQFQMIIMIAGIVLAILSPVIAMLIQLSISRKREFLADASGALLTRYPEGLASALEKINKYGKPMLRANYATAHLFIANPFGAQAFRGMHKLFMTHPPAEERIKVLREM